MARRTLPQVGLDMEEVTARLEELKAGDVDWRAGRAAVYVFDAGEDVRQIAKQAYGAYMSENGLGMRAFPSLAQMERDILDFGLDLLNAPEDAEGALSSGGTESIFLAVKTCRDYQRARGRDISRAEILLPQSAHPAFNKAAHYLGLKARRLPLGDDFRVDLSAMRAAVSDETIMIVGSAPNFPFGIIDDIAALGALAEEKDLWLHVDACVGGYFAPFARRLGVALPDWDFTVPGVSSISADLHKYGYAAKGASTVFYRHRELYDCQPFAFSDWPVGTMVTPGFSGTRPGGAIAAAWAVMNYLGMEGYCEKAAEVLRARRQLQDFVVTHPQLKLHGSPQLGLINIGSDDLDILAVGEKLAARGWVSARTARPPGLHLMLSPEHGRIMDEYLGDLRQCLEEATGRTGKPAGKDGFYN